MITISAWEKPEHIQMLRQGTHKDAMARFFVDDGVALGGSTSVWQPLRRNPLWVRCTSCQAMVVSEGDAPRCRCGADLPRDVPYW